MWQPIETAPRDATAILVMRDTWPGTRSGRAEECNGHNTYVAAWWSDEPGGQGAWICSMDAVLDTECPVEPTHWMPLPDPPGAQPAPSVPDGWLRAIDEALVVANIGVANAEDTYEQAKAKLDSLIGWHTDVATDPAVNGGYRLIPIEPTEDMLRAMTDPFVAINGDNRKAFEIAYTAMLAAAPEAKP